MASRLGKRRVRRILIALGVLVILGGLTAIFLPPYLRRSQVEKRLSAFGANPCQKTADALIALLGEDDVTQEQATEILKALLQPKVVAEDSYITGQPVKIRIERKNPIKVVFFASASISSSLFIEGITGQNGVENSESLGIAPELSEQFLLNVPMYDFDVPDQSVATSHRVTITNTCLDPPILIWKAGTYKGKVRLSYDTSRLYLPTPIPSFLERILTKLGLSKSQPQKDPTSNFKYTYEIPFQIRVVAPKPTSPGDVDLLPAR